MSQRKNYPRQFTVTSQQRRTPFNLGWIDCQLICDITFTSITCRYQFTPWWGETMIRFISCPRILSLTFWELAGGEPRAAWLQVWRYTDWATDQFILLKMKKSSVNVNDNILSDKTFYSDVNSRTLHFFIHGIDSSIMLKISTYKKCDSLHLLMKTWKIRELWRSFSFAQCLT